MRKGAERSIEIVFSTLERRHENTLDNGCESRRNRHLKHGGKIEGRTRVPDPSLPHTVRGSASRLVR